MKTYKITPQDDKGLLRISFVEQPAINSGLMAFSEEGKQMQFLKEDQQIIFAPALIPNKLIFRNSIKGENANVYFDAETIKRLQIDGARNGYDNRINLNHEDDNTDGIFCFESWIIEDEVKDKAYKMGFDVPVGTLMKGYKIDNDEVWSKIKKGEITGLSIEAFLDPIEDEILNFKQEQMNKKGVLEYIKSLFAADDSKEFATGYFGQSLEEGAIVTDAEGNPKPNESFDCDGKKYHTDDMGAISKIEEIEEMEDEPKEDVEKMKSRIEELETENADLKAQLTKGEEVKMSAENDIKAIKETHKEELSKLESELIELKRIPNVPDAKEVPYAQMSRKQKLEHNKQK